MSDPYRIADFGPSDLLTSANENKRRVKMSINEDLIDGGKALTVQPFTEVSSKLGTQYETAFYVDALLFGGNADVVIVVGAEPILIKDVQVEFNSVTISSQIFRGPTYTGGTELPVYNFNDEQAVPDDVVVIGGVSTSDTGTPVGPKIFSLGGEGQGNRRIASVSQRTGVERVLWPGASYLFRITNEDGITTRIAGTATWYQGPLSTQTPLEL